MVNTEFRSLSTELETIKEEFGSSDLTDDEKLAVISDIDSLLAQLQKPSPSEPVVKCLWESIQKTAAVASITSALVKAGEMISPLLV